MDQTTVPIELISFRGLLKSFEDIQKGNFMKTNKRNAKYDKKDGNVFTAVKNLLVFTVFQIMSFFENVLISMQSKYDHYVNIPLKRYLTTNVDKFMPTNYKDFFNLNDLLIFRMMLFIPVSLCLKLHFNYVAFGIFMFQSNLSQLNTIFSQNKNSMKSQLNCFLIRFCNKLIHVITLLTILQTANFESLDAYLVLFVYSISYSVIFYNIWIGSQYIQDYFEVKYKKDTMIKHSTVETKIKEKLEPIGIASLCLAIDSMSGEFTFNGWGVFGLSCLLITIRMAHKGVRQQVKINLDLKNNEKNAIAESEQKRTQIKHERLNSNEIELDVFRDANTFEESLVPVKFGLFEELSESEDKAVEETVLVSTAVQTENVANNSDAEKRIVKDGLVDTIYTIGCFDLFHDGHIRLLKRMRNFGKKLIVGVHDSRSIYKLKNRVPVDSTEKRMLNVKQYADVVFCIPATDPSEIMRCIIHIDTDKNERAMYVRGDDMPNFPSRNVIEKFMPIKLISYTQGVSSTQLRNEMFSHIKSDDENYLEKNS